MTKKRSAKNAFISSLVMLCLCVTMLVGTTFAWYTDSVTSGRNTIVAGSLDITLTVYKEVNNVGTWVPVDDQTAIFPDDIMFEPGAVHVAYVKVANTGDLAFKYNLAAVVDTETAGINQAGNPFYLSEYLKFKAVEVTGFYTDRATAVAALGTNPPSLTGASLADGAVLKAGDPEVMLALIIYMPENVGDEANPKPGDANKPKITFGLNAIATQYTIENDSFGNTYDATAPLPGQAIATVFYDANATTATQVDAGIATATIPAATELVANNQPVDDTELVLTVEEVETAGNIVVETSNGATSYEVSLETAGGDAVSASTGLIKVELNVGVVTITNFYHNGTPMTEKASVDALSAANDYYYDGSKITMLVDSFSPFTVVYKYAGGNGSEDHPYLIANRAHLEGINDLYETEAAFYKMAQSNMVIDATDMPFLNLNGCFDGNGLTVNNVSRPLFYDVIYENNTNVIKNLTVNANVARNNYFDCALIYRIENDIILENVDIHGYIEATCAAPYIAFGPGPSIPVNYLFKNCHSDATVIATGESTSGFVAHPYCGAGSTMTFEGSRFTGTMAAKGNTFYFRVNASGSITITTDETDGASLYTNPAASYSGNADLYTSGGVKYKAGTKLTTGTITAPEGIDLVSIPKAAGASYAVATLNIGPNDTNEKGNYTGVYMRENCDEVDGNFVTKTIKNFIITVNGASTVATGISADGSTFNIVSAYYGTTYGSASVKIIQYDANGTIVSINSLNLKN